jgi:hypothetical protein
MQADRTTKILLAVIAVALWGLLLRPVVTPAQAADAPRQDVNATITRIGETPVALSSDGSLVTVDAQGHEARLVRITVKPEPETAQAEIP